jgi:Uncharacterized conserved protein
MACPNVETAKVVMNGVSPKGYHATSIFPEYYKINGKWVIATQSRMDCVVVVKDDGEVDVREFRRLSVGERVILGRNEDGSEGIYVHTRGFSDVKGGKEVFAFRTGRSRETSFSRDYDQLYEVLRYERDHGYTVFVLGPAVVFDHDARNAMVSLIENGFVHAILAGNAVATHDLEGSLFRTALGQDVYTQAPLPNGHYHHLEVINRARAYSTLADFVKSENINDGIVHACVNNNVPIVLAGSIRDDGPLPGVYADVYAAQDAMRYHTRRATTVLGLATQLHTIATGNMTPAYQVINDVVRPVYIYSVDISEFVVNKLRDRGSLEVTSIVANIQDFLVNLQRNLII